MPAYVVITREKTRDAARVVRHEVLEGSAVEMDRIIITRMITIAVRG